ncbi:MAG: hypothetical protein F4X45_08670 [Chloroflexi bacterium]|nr:hypothetical protein [Chloroflexota bacterium]
MTSIAYQLACDNEVNDEMVDRPPLPGWGLTERAPGDLDAAHFSGQYQSSQALATNRVFGIQTKKSSLSLKYGYIRN